MLVLVLVHVTSFLSSFAIILTRKRELVALLLFGCLATVTVLWLFLTVPWVVLQFKIVVFSDHTHFLFDTKTITVELSPSIVYIMKKMKNEW